MEAYGDGGLRARLQHVRWIGGGSGAGKSTVAGRLAHEHGLALYHTEPFSKYVGRADAADVPLLQGFMAMSMDERWVDRTPEVMFRTFHGFHGEGFGLVVEDLLALSAEPPVLTEGFSLLPRLVAPLLTHRRQAVWLLPTPDFRRAAFESRGSTWAIPNRTSDPERALTNLLARDRLFTEMVRREAESLDLQIVDVDGHLTVDELVREVGEALDLRGAC
jgi:2-phosphoglycerate kinase